MSAQPTPPPTLILARRASKTQPAIPETIPPGTSHSRVHAAPHHSRVVGGKSVREPNLFLAVYDFASSA